MKVKFPAICICKGKYKISYTWKEMHHSFLILGFTCDSSFMCKFSVNQVQRKFLRPYQIWHQLHFLLRDGQLGQLVELPHNNGPWSWYSILLKASILFQSPLLNKRYSWFCFISVSFQSKFESHYVNEALLFDFVLYFNHTGMLPYSMPRFSRILAFAWKYVLQKWEGYNFLKLWNWTLHFIGLCLTFLSFFSLSAYATSTFMTNYMTL